MAKTTETTDDETIEDAPPGVEEFLDEIGNSDTEDDTEDKVDISTLIAEATDGMEFSWEYIDPESAQTILEDQKPNRRTKSVSLSKLRRALETGDFIPNGETIKFDKKGHLVDGQHRLRACIETGKGFVTAVVTGVTPVAQRTIDQGSPRRLADQIDMSNPDISATEATALADVTIAIYTFLNGSIQSGRATRPTFGQALEFFQENEDRIKECTNIAVELQKDKELKIKRAATGAMMFVLDIVDHEASQKFFQELVSGLRSDGKLLDDNDPVAVLRKRFARSARDKNHRISNTRIAMALMVKTWNAFCQGEKISRLMFVASDDFPEIYGMSDGMLPNPDENLETQT